MYLFLGLLLVSSGQVLHSSLQYNACLTTRLWFSILTMVIWRSGIWVLTGLVIYRLSSDIRGWQAILEDVYNLDCEWFACLFGGMIIPGDNTPLFRVGRGLQSQWYVVSKETGVERLALKIVPSKILSGIIMKELEGGI